jgi:hypothetical protein
MIEYQLYFDSLFDNADQLMWTLSAQEDFFTNYAYIREMSRTHQPIYVDILKDVRDEYGRDDVFREAHKAIGRHLRTIAEQAGYVIDKNSGIKDTNIWGQSVSAVIYRRTDQVNDPEQQ